MSTTPTVHNLTPAQREALRTALKVWDDGQHVAKTGELSDSSNPAFILATVRTGLLELVAAGAVDLNALARIELASRGVALDGSTYAPVVAMDHLRRAVGKGREATVARR